MPNAVKTYSMDDVGTRIEHLADLQDLWGTALQILTNGTYHTEREKAEAKEIEIALRLLSYHMMNSYTPTAYAKEINKLPKKAEDIV